MAKSVKPDANSLFQQMYKPEPVVQKAPAQEEMMQTKEKIKRAIEIDNEEIDSAKESIESEKAKPAEPFIKAPKKSKAPVSASEIDAITEEGLRSEMFDTNKKHKRNENFLVAEDGYIDRAIKVAKMFYGNNKSFYYRKLIIEDYLKNKDKYENFARETLF